MTRFETLVFVDASVEASEVLTHGLDLRARVHHLPRSGDPLETIAVIAAESGPVDRIAILTHGSPGRLTLCGRPIGEHDLAAATGTLETIGKSLAPSGEVLLVSCSTGLGVIGRAFVAALEDALGVTVHASETDLGSDAGWDGLPAAAKIFASSALATYPARLAVIQGTGANDTLVGTADADTISGNNGNDVISGGGGVDWLDGGSGNDVLSGGAGNDYLYPLYGDDLVYGGAGDDSIYTTDGSDTVFGGAGNDYIGLALSGRVSGGSGNDEVKGSLGRDTIHGDDGDDLLSGDWSSDILDGGAGADTLFGGRHSDRLIGGDGADVLNGGTENDTYVGTVAEFNGDTISGAAAGDVIEISGDTSFATSLNGGTVGGSLTLGGSTITFANAGAGLYFKGSVVGGNSLLTLTTAKPNQPGTGGGGNALSVSGQSSGDVSGSEVSRTLTNATGGTATGTVVENTGSGNTVTVTLPEGASVTMSGSPNALDGADAAANLKTLFQNSVDDAGGQAFLTGQVDQFIETYTGTPLDIRFFSFQNVDVGTERIRFSSEYSGGGDAFVFDASGLPSGTTLQLSNIDFAAIIGNATVHSLNGNSYLVGDAGKQSFILAGADNTVAGGGGADTIQGSDGGDLIYGNQGSDYLDGGNGNDVLFGGQDADTVFAGAGADVAYGNRGSDIVFGGDGADTMFGGQDSDVLYGNVGDDRLYGNRGDDLVFGGQGNDHVFGQSGNDSLAGNHGDDLLIGGDGADVFIFDKDGGNDTVADFQVGTDSLQFAEGLTYTVAASDAGTQLTLSDGGTVMLVGVPVSSFGAAFGWEFG